MLGRMVGDAGLGLGVLRELHASRKRETNIELEKHVLRGAIGVHRAYSHTNGRTDESVS